MHTKPSILSVHRQSRKRGDRVPRRRELSSVWNFLRRSAKFIQRRKSGESRRAYHIVQAETPPSPPRTAYELPTQSRRHRRRLGTLVSYQPGREISSEVLPIVDPVRAYRRGERSTRLRIPCPKPWDRARWVVHATKQVATRRNGDCIGGPELETAQLVS